MALCSMVAGLNENIFNSERANKQNMAETTSAAAISGNGMAHGGGGRANISENYNNIAVAKSGALAKIHISKETATMATF